MGVLWWKSWGKGPGAGGLGRVLRRKFLDENLGAEVPGQKYWGGGPVIEMRKRI